LRLNELFSQNTTISEVADGIVHMPFLSSAGVNMVLTAVKAVGNWGETGPHYPTQDIHLEKDLPTVDKLLRDRLHTVIYPEVKNYFFIDTEFDVFALFAIKYAMDSQKSLDIHHDQSFISASVKLNDDYEGGVLKFPRQRYDNSKIPVGDIILWPGDITHPHLCTELQTNEKHALTIWSKPCGKW
jgi:hypothetical protein